MLKKFYVINPAPKPKKKRRTGSQKKRSAKMKGLVIKTNPMKGASMAVRKKGRRTKTRRAKKNPVTVVSAPRKRRATAPRITYINPRRARVKKRYRRNPDGGAVSVSMDPLKAQNALQYGAGAVGGVFVPQIIGNMLGFTGNAKYLTQAGVGLAGYIVAKKLGMPKAGLAFLISSIAITAMEFSMDYGIMQGAHTLLGVNYAPPRLNGMVPRMNGMIPAGQPLRGIVPYNQPSRISGNGGAYSGYDN